MERNTREIYNIDYFEALFIDDVDTVAQAAKVLDMPFIGCPANFQWGFQKEEMLNTGVKYIVDSADEITQDILDRIDADAARGVVWATNGEVLKEEVYITKKTNLPDKLKKGRFNASYKAYSGQSRWRVNKGYI